MAVAFDNSSNGTGAGVTGSFSIVSSGNNRVIVVWVFGVSAAGLVSSITCDGVPMTLTRNSGGFSGWSCTTYTLIGQNAGTNSIQVNWSVDTGSSFSMLAATYTGANGIDGTGAAVSSSFNTVTVSLTNSNSGTLVTSAVGALNGSGISNASSYVSRLAEFSNLSGLTATIADSNGGFTPGTNNLIWNWSGFNSIGGTTAIGIQAGLQPSKASGLFMVSD